ncbi:MAG: 4-hydroxythreonine-4-phosphate dehydrogenase PdxA [Candidatus Cloacimonetes bacterium]|nr:4-hydroxythreonine-4-phosphate dehydrogenase PdxA [Candidatus Cloacimonadota bacterium]
MKKIIITTGDPAGIGPEICSRQLRFHQLKKEVIYIVYGKLFTYHDGNNIEKISKLSKAKEPNKIYWIEIDKPVIIGKPTKQSGKISYEILKRCAKDILKNKIDAVVTCPISKTAIQEIEKEFIGHTEFFAKASGSHDEIMTFWSKYFNLALLTTHSSIKEIINSFDAKIIEKKIKNIHKYINEHLTNPKIALLSINPHSGENGSFGDEDIVLEQILIHLSEENIIIDGPFPSDTFFYSKVRNYDFVISLFHDQGLIPFKMLAADHGVNVTLGIPFLRTSVDHGTAFDIAGKNIASEESFANALFFAENTLLKTKFTDKIIYNNFAKYYDKYMQHVDYNLWVEFILEKYFEVMKTKPKKILEIACGTGNICNKIAYKGYKIYGCDNSSEMLKIAASKSNKVNYFWSDYKKEIQKTGFDFAILLFDSINYCLTQKELLTTLRNVYKCLKENSLFIFDISTLKNCEDNFDGFVNLDESQDSYIIHQSHLDYEESTLTTSLTFFIKNNYLFERNDEVHIQHIYYAREVAQLVHRANFELIGVFRLNSSENLIYDLDKEIDNKFTRLYFVLKK